MTRLLLAALLAAGCGKTTDTSETGAPDTGDTMDTVDTMDTADTMDTVDTVDTVDTALDGEALYAANCAVCHGAEATGGAQGPALYNEVAVHSDEQLVDVILNGDRDMPPVDVTEDEAYAIVGFLHELLGV